MSDLTENSTALPGTMLLRRTAATSKVVRVLWGAALGTALLLPTSAASASESFPAQVNQDLSLGCDPTCAICHEADPGVAGSAKKNFAYNMIYGGLQAQNPATVASALDYVEAMNLDADSDGTNDVAALRAYEDPNGLLTADICNPNVQAVKYGCGAHVAPQADQASVLPWGLAALALGAALFLRRRRA